MILLADSEGPDRTAQMSKQIWAQLFKGNDIVS